MLNTVQINMIMFIFFVSAGVLLEMSLGLDQIVPSGLRFVAVNLP